MDGHTARSEGGVATIRSIGDLLNELQNADCFLVYDDAIGLNIQDHSLRCTLILSSRLLLAFSMVAHQPTPVISFPATAHRDLIAKADLLYVSLPPNASLVVFNTRTALANRLEAVYDINGKPGISSQPAFTLP